MPRRGMIICSAADPESIQIKKCKVQPVVWSEILARMGLVILDAGRLVEARTTMCVKSCMPMRPPFVGIQWRRSEFRVITARKVCHSR